MMRSHNFPENRLRADPAAPRRGAWAPLAAGVAALLLLLLLGCQNRSESTGGAEPDQVASQSGEDEHGHGHGHAGEGEAGHKGEEGHADEVTLTPEAMKQNGVEVGTVRADTLRPRFTVPARVAFNTEEVVHVGAPLPGRVSELRVKLGDFVKKGDVLLVIESTELGAAQNEYLQKRTAVQSAAPSLELVQKAFNRAKTLYDQSKGIALSEVQKREIELKAAQAALQTAKTSLLTAENALRLWGMDSQALETLATSGQVRPYFNVIAPISGQVVEREITLRERVSPEKEQLMVIANTETVWVVADVPESRLSRIRVGAEADITVGDADKPNYRGRVSFIEPTIDSATRTARVRIEVKNESRALRPGMFARTDIEAAPSGDADDKPVVIVPDEAVQTWEGRKVVFAAQPNEENVFAARPVTVGKAVKGWVPVIAGLTPGERIVTKGSFIIKADLGKSTAAHEH